MLQSEMLQRGGWIGARASQILVRFGGWAVALASGEHPVRGAGSQQIVSFMACKMLSFGS